MIAIISGTNRENNNSIHIAREVAANFHEMGEAVELLDLGELPPEAFSPGIFREKPAALKEAFTDKVLASDGLVIVVPEYNGSFPGILKHFIDLWPFPEAFEGRPVAFVGLSAGRNGAVRAVEQLQMVFAHRNAWLCNRRVFIPAVGQVLDAEGRITDESLRDRLREQGLRFKDFVRRMRAEP